jgi:hypothetical protein
MDRGDVELLYGDREDVDGRVIYGVMVVVVEQAGVVFGFASGGGSPPVVHGSSLAHGFSQTASGKSF